MRGRRLGSLGPGHGGRPCERGARQDPGAEPDTPGHTANLLKSLFPRERVLRIRAWPSFSARQRTAPGSAVCPWWRDGVIAGRRGPGLAVCAQVEGAVQAEETLLALAHAHDALPLAAAPVEARHPQAPGASGGDLAGHAHRRPRAAAHSAQGTGHRAQGTGGR